MPAEVLISEVVDINGTTKDLDALLAQINKVDQAIQTINKNPIKLGQVAGLKELKVFTDQLVQSMNQLNTSVLSLSRSGISRTFQDSAQSQKENAKAVNENSTAYQKLKDEAKAAEVNAKNMATEFGRESEQAVKAAAAYEVLRLKLEEVNSITKKPTVAQPQNVPLSSNIGSINEENVRVINATGEAVNNLEKQEAEAANTAVAFGQSQLEATGSLDAEAKILPEITSALDQYTGSITGNIQAQIENNAALAANRASQKEILTTIEASGAATEEQSAKLAHLKAEEISLVEINRDLTTTIKNQVKEQSTQIGSIDNLRAKVNLLQRAYEGLSATEKRSETGVSLKRQIDDLEPSLKAAEGEIGKYSRNVGNYASGFTKVFSTSFSYLRQLAYLIPGIGMAGIINLITEGIINLTKSIFDSGSATSIANGQTKEMIELQKELSSAVSNTADAFISYENAVSKSNSGILDKLKGQLSVLEASGVNVEQTFALKRRIAQLEAEGASGENDINVRLATKERADVISDLKTQISLLEKRNTGFNKSAANTQRLDELKKELSTLDVVVTKENAVELSREFHRKNILSLDNQIIAANNKLGELISTGAGKKDIERQKEYIQNLNSREQIESKVYNNLTSSQQKYVQTSTALDSLETEVSKFNADERRKYELESQKILVDEKKALTQSVLADQRSSLEEQLNAINILSQEQENLINKEKQAVLSNPGSSKVDKVIAETRAAEQLYALTVQTEDQKFQIQERFRIKDLEAERQAFDQKKQLTVDELKQFSSSSEFSLSERVAFQQAAFQAQKDIIDKDHAAKLESVKNTKLSANEELAIQTDYETKLLDLTRKSQVEITNIIQSSIERRQQLSLEEVGQIERIYRDINLSQNSQYTQDVIDLNNSLKDKLIGYTDYLKQRRELDNKYRIETLQSNINQLGEELNKPIFSQAKTQLDASRAAVSSFEQLLKDARTDQEKESALSSLTIARKDYDISKDNYDKKVSLENQLNDLKKEINESGLKITEDDFRRVMDNVAQALGQTSQLAQQLGAFGSAIHQQRLNEIESEQTALDARYQKEQDLIKQTYLNQVDQQQKLAEAEKRYNAQKDQIQQRQRQEQIKQARFEKEANIASIILNTAAAVVKALPNIPLSIAAGVIGAAELAVAIATPLPKFFKGKNVDAVDNYEGYAWVDDGGKPEAIIREDGSVEIGSNKPRVTYLKSKDIVLPDASVLAWKATASTAAAREGYVVNNTFDSTEIVSELKVNNRLLKSIKNKQPLRIYKSDPMDGWINGKINTDDLFG